MDFGRIMRLISGRFKASLPKPDPQGRVFLFLSPKIPVANNQIIEIIGHFTKTRLIRGCECRIVAITAKGRIIFRLMCYVVVRAYGTHAHFLFSVWDILKA